MGFASYFQYIVILPVIFALYSDRPSDKSLDLPVDGVDESPLGVTSLLYSKVH